MTVCKPIRLVIATQADVITCRQKAREAAIVIGFGLADQTRLATAVSELARNALRHAGGGSCLIHAVQHDGRNGIEVLVEDEGPGIADIEQAMTDGYSTNGGLGAGLGGMQRLMDEFEITSESGLGTRIVMRKWVSGLQQ